MQDRIYLQRVQEHRHSGDLLELRATPTFFLNGEIIDVTLGLENLKEAVCSLIEKLNINLSKEY